MLEQDKQISVVNPYLVVPNVDEAADYYLQAYGALQSERYEDSSGKVWYAVLKIFGSPLQLMEPDREMGLVAKDPADGEDSIAVNIDVPNVDFTFNRVLRAGAEVRVDLRDAEWGGRTAEVTDPMGHRWILGPRLYKKDRRRTPLAPQIVVEDVGEAVGFWQRVIGARETRRVPGRARGNQPFTILRVGGAALQFTGPDPARRLAPIRREGPAKGDSAMVTVIADDVDAMFERAIENGGTPIVEPQDAFWGDRYAEFRDVSGLRVSTCGETTFAEAVVDPAELQRELNNFLSIHNDPNSPAQAVRVKNVVVE